MKKPTFRQVTRYVFICLLFILFTFNTGKTAAQEWQPSVELVNTADDIDLPVVAASNHMVYAAWNDERGTTVFDEIYFKRSTDFGLTWEAGIKLSEMPTGSGATSSRIATRDNFVHVVWAQYNTIHDQVYYTRSTDDGASFSTPVEISFPPSDIHDPDIAVFEDHVHVVYRDDRALPLQSIYYLRSDDNGNTWNVEKLLTVDGQIAYKPRIAVSGFNVFVSWNEQTNNPSEIFFMRSVDNGENWDAPLLLANTGIIQSQHAIAAASEHDIHVAWEDKRDGHKEIYYRASHDGGENWEPELRLSFTTLWSTDPCLAAVGDKVFICYTLMTGAEHIYFMESNNGGAEWSESLLLDENTGLAINSSIAAFSEDIFAVWTEGSVAGDKDVYFRRRIDHSSLDETGPYEHTKPVLYQNHPNPVVDETSIKFFLPESGEAWVEVIGLDGKVAGIIGKGVYPAGMNTIKWHAGKIKSGAYMYRLLTDKNDPGQRPVARKLVVK